MYLFEDLAAAEHGFMLLWVDVKHIVGVDNNKWTKVCVINPAVNHFAPDKKDQKTGLYSIFSIGQLVEMAR